MSCYLSTLPLALFLVGCGNQTSLNNDKSSFLEKKLTVEQASLIASSERFIRDNVKTQTPIFTLSCPSILEEKLYFIVRFENCIENTTGWEFDVYVEKKGRKPIKAVVLR